MTTFKGNRKYPNPVTVTDDPKSHTLALQQIIEALNTGQRRTRDIGNSFVRLQELVDVGLIEIVGNQLKLTNAGSALATGGASALADLTDVDLTGLADGDVLIYDSATMTWVPGAVSGAGPITGADMYDVSLSDLADVSIYLPQDGNVLTYNSETGQWEAGDPNIATTVGGLGPLSPDTPPVNPENADDEFEYGTTLDTSGERRAAATSWAWRNQDQTTAAVGGGNLILVAPSDAGRELHGVEQVTSGVYVYRCKFAVKHDNDSTMMGGVYVGVNSSGKLLSLSLGYTGGAQTLQVDRWTDATTHSTAVSASTTIDEDHDKHDWLYVEIVYDVYNDITFKYSKTGVEGTFITFHSEDYTTFLGAAPDRIGIWAASSASAKITVLVCDWFRQVPSDGFVYPPSLAQLQTRGLVEVIQSLNPLYYFILNESGGTYFQDYGPYRLQATLSGSYTPRYSVMVPSLPGDKYLRFANGTNYARATVGAELSRPLTRDWTMSCICVPQDIGASTMWLFAISGDGESEAVNYQAALAIYSTGRFFAYWEYGAGGDMDVDSGVAIPEGYPVMLTAVKDFNAKTVTFYVNGVKVSTVAYANEVTGGTGTCYVGPADVGTVGNTKASIIGHCAFWDGVKLSDYQIAQMARAAGLFGAPVLQPPTPYAVVGNADVQVFTTTGSNLWTKPANANVVTAILVGGGGGGGGGRKQATSNTRAGGGGGGGGGLTIVTWPASAFGDTETAYVGAGGTGGSGATADNGTGSSGTAGESSFFGSTLFVAGGGGGGNGSTAATNAGGAGGVGQNGTGGAGGTGGTTTATAGNSSTFAAGGGAGGGGITSGNAFGRGWDGGAVTAPNPDIAGGTSTNSQGANGGNGGSYGQVGIPGGGGASGSGQATAGLNGGDGGAGGLYGGGGGGGAGCINGAGRAGNGGNGANGCVIICTV